MRVGVIDMFEFLDLHEDQLPAIYPVHYMFSVGQSVVLNIRGVKHVKDTFGNLWGIGDPWIVTAKTASSLAPWYTLLSTRGIVFEGVNEDFLAPAPPIQIDKKEG